MSDNKSDELENIVRLSIPSRHPTLGPMLEDTFDDPYTGTFYRPFAVTILKAGIEEDLNRINPDPTGYQQGQIIPYNKDKQ